MDITLIGQAHNIEKQADGINFLLRTEYGVVKVKALPDFKVTENERITLVGKLHSKPSFNYYLVPN